MKKETLHFTIQSPGNMAKLLCTILFEKGDQDKEYEWVWHKAFEGEKGDKLFEQFLVELFPEGCVIGEPEIKRVIVKALKYLKTDVDCLELKAKYDKSMSNSYVYFAPLHKVFPCDYTEHTETVSKILADYFGEAIKDYDLEKLKNFISSSFEIESDNTSVAKIVRDMDYLQLRSYQVARGWL